MNRSVLRALAELIRPEWRRYALGTLTVLVSVASAMLYPQIVRLLVDEGVRGGHVERINGLVLWGVLVLAIDGAATFVRTFLFDTAGARVGHALRDRLFRHLLRQEVAFFETRHSAELSSRLASDTAAVHHFAGMELEEGIRFLLYSVCGIGLLFYTSPALTLYMLSVVPPAAILVGLLGRRLRRLARDEQDAEAHAAAIAKESFGGIRAIRLFGSESAEGDRYSGVLQRLAGVAQRAAIGRSYLETMSMLASEAVVLMAIWAGGRLILAGDLTAGAVFSFILYADMVARALRNLVRVLAEGVRAVGASDRLFEWLDRAPAIPLQGGHRLAEVRGDVALEDVRFRYPSRPERPALRGADLQVKPGRIVALVGASGAGKSTVAALLCRLYDPEGGRVLLDGADLRELDPLWVRRQIALVPQEPLLFDRSLADNIRFGEDAAGQDAVMNAARLAHIHDFIAALPRGYDSGIGENGVQLSGGQRQRVAIARAVLRGSRVLVLDEPTSALDARNERLLHETLAALKKDRAILVIAHRLTTVALADEVVLMEDGRTIAAGTHDELLARSPAYASLVRTQLLTADGAAS